VSEDGRLSERLFEVGRPFIQAHLEHPTVVALCRGTLDVAVARSWLEQDYLYLEEEVRVLARLAWMAPPSHRREIVGLLCSVVNEEIPRHVRMCREWGASPGTAVMGPATRAYTGWLLDAASDYGIGMAALLSGLWGYSTLGPLMTVPENSRYREWVQSYQDPAFGELARRFANMVDEAAPDPAAAKAIFVEGMRHEIRFWSPPSGVAATGAAAQEGRQ
jgi:thiaminase (transcriptional activator TenA)